MTAAAPFAIFIACSIAMTTLTSASAAQSTARGTPEHTAPAVAPPAPLRDGRHDFDFLHGAWRIHNRRLRSRLTGSTEWFEFEGQSTERPLWDGQANIEEYDATMPDGTRLRGLALRLYDPNTRRWTIHWSNGAAGTLDAPMTGTFRDGVGVFYSHEDYQGRMVLVRFHWTSDPPDRARWEQAFSADGGETWETNWIMEFTRTASAESVQGSTRPAGRELHDTSSPTACCPIVELRHYVLHHGARETLIDIFDREFVEPQEATGMQVIAQFRDIDRPDVFTWLRGFPDMASRATSLGAFYGGPVWAQHRNAANATMISSDDVRLLHPVRPRTGFVLGDRAAAGATAIPPGLVVATIYTLTPAAASSFNDFFEGTLMPRFVASGARPFAAFETEASANTFPRLPVREGEHAFVWFSRFDDVGAYERHAAALGADPLWTRELQPALARMLTAPVEVWRLTPTARSRQLR